ncbi:ABC transporter ATP-binding protein, partial [Escherichia coli]|nr:ABC transporter ATP-binding protein [Escherichia coli]
PGCALGVIAIAVLKGLCGYFTATRMALAGSRILSIIRKSLFTHLLRLPLSAHQELRAGDLTMRLINDIGMMRDAMVTAVMPLLSSLTVFTGMAGIMLWLNWQLTVVALLPVPLLVLVTVWRGRRIRDVNRVQRQHEGELAARSAEFMTAIATVQAMALEKDAIRAFEGPERQSLQQNVKARKQAVGLECLIELLIAGITAMVLLLGARSVLSGKMSAGELLVFLSYLKNMFRPVREFARYSTRLIRAFTAGERVAGLLHYLPVEYSVEGKKLPLSEMPDIRFENVSFTYREGKNGECGRTLHNVSFHLPSGHTLAVTGPSGAGKSTLSRLLLRLYEPDSGRILLGKNELHEFCVTSLRQRIGYLPQEPLLFGYSIRDNITLGAGKTFSDDEIIAAARQANAHEFISGLPQGYNTIVGERGNTLSGGQRQRIAIARVILLNTPFILLDEPGVGLDSINELA